MLVSIGDLTVNLTRKNVRRVNIRITPDGSVAVSAPFEARLDEIAAIIKSKEEPIKKAIVKTQQRQNATLDLGDDLGDSVFIFGERFALERRSTPPFGVFESEGRLTLACEPNAEKERAALK